MAEEPYKILKKLLKTAAALAVVAGIGYSFLALARDLDHARPIEGITTYLRNKDIYSVSLSASYLWAGGADGLYRIERAKGGEVSISDTGGTGGENEAENAVLREEKVGDYQYIRAVLADGEKVWIGHDGGLTLWENGVTTDFTDRDGLPDIRVNALFLDSAGDLWIGTWGGAAVLRDSKIVRTLTAENGLIDNMVNVILQDSRGGMWFGSYVAPRGGISVLTGGKWQYFTTQNALVHSNINTIIEMRDGDILAGGGLYTQGGGTRFSWRDGQWNKISMLTKEIDKLAGAKIRSMLEDSKGRLWVGSEYEGLAVLKNGTSTVMTTKNGLSNDEVKDFAEEEDGTVWIGTREGLVRIYKGRIDDVR